MKYLPVVMLLALVGCSPGGERAESDEGSGTDSTNQVLYNQVMDIHDEVMPRMEDLYNMKKDIEEKLKDPGSLTETQKQALSRRLAQVDSVSKLMMDWMHEFEPLPDSADKEESRAYLEQELEKIKIVKQAMLETIEAGSAN
jgi:hypothetical protein